MESMAKDQHRNFVIGEWTVKPAMNQIVRDRQARSLQPQSMNVLAYLAQYAGEVVSSEQLLEAFWPNRVAGDDAVHRRIADLRKHLEDDAKQPIYIQTIPKRGYRLVAPVEFEPLLPAPPDALPSASGSRLGAGAVGTALIALVLLCAGAYVAWSHRTAEQREAVIATAQALLDEDRHQEAYRALEPWLDSGSGPRLDALLEAITLPTSIVTRPAGIQVSYRWADAPDDPWVELGTTPISGHRLPRGAYKLRFGDRVYMHATHPGATLNSAGVSERVIEMPTEPIPPNMVFVPSGKYRLGAWGFDGEQDLGGYLIDRTEVTNLDYLEFVDGGGYQDARYWQPLIDASAGQLSLDVVHKQFVDRTGQPGPADWELGSFGSGAGQLPVTGVSWYEAAAYLAYRNQEMPTVQHWLRAALGPMEWKYPFATTLVPGSNVAGEALLPVASLSGAEAHGAYDLIGNALEWTSNRSGGDTRIVIGGSFREPPWSYNLPVRIDPLLRSGDLGFRGMRRTPQSLRVDDSDINLFDDLYAPVRRVSNEVFEGMSYLYAYRPGQVDARDVPIIEESATEYGTRQTILIPTERATDPMPVHVHLPRKHSGPLQAVIYLPPADSWSGAMPSAALRLDAYQLDFVPRSGRALLWPIYSGTHERYDGFHSAGGPERAKLAVERNRRVRDEIGRVLDYLESDPRFDGSRVALMGLSHGAIMASYPLALEKRLRAAVLYSVGVAPTNPIFANPQNDPNVFWARVDQPTLVMNGRYDPIRPHQRLLEPLIELLATPPEHKAGVLVESGHWPLPRQRMMQETLAWLDRYLGPVTPSADPSRGKE